MFGPIRGPWPDEAWKGWWGELPPFGGSVFVLTHSPREPVPVWGGTTLHFVTDGIRRALERARAAADGKDVGVGGGVATVRESLRAGLIDEVSLAVAPVLLGEGERFPGDLDLVRLGYRTRGYTPGERAMHVVLEHIERRTTATRTCGRCAVTSRPEALTRSTTRR
jgi:dihydrofolate reductase